MLVFGEPVFPDLKTCSVIEAGCEVRYRVDRLVTGDEPDIVVYFDRNQSDARTLRDDPGTLHLSQHFSLIPNTCIVCV